MKIYIAGKWEEKERVREVMQQLIVAGHSITYDWTKDESSFTERQALADREGVLEADAFVGVFEKDLRYSGALVEMGIAVARGIPVHILGNAVDGNIFILLPTVNRGLGTLLDGRETVRNRRAWTSSGKRARA